MDHLLDLTRQAEATHFWFRGFRSFVRPVFASVAAGRTDLRAARLRLRHRPQPRAAGAATADAFGFDLIGRRAGAGARRRAAARARRHRRHSVCRPTPSTSRPRSTCCSASRPTARRCARWRACVKPGGAVVLTVAALDVLRGDHAEVWREVPALHAAPRRGALAEQAGLRAERVVFMFASLFPLMLVRAACSGCTRPFRGSRADTRHRGSGGAGQRRADVAGAAGKRRSRAASRCRSAARCWWWRGSRSDGPEAVAAYEASDLRAVARTGPCRRCTGPSSSGRRRRRRPGSRP